MKSVLDVSLATLLVVALSPIFAVLSFLVLLRMGRPILFRQERLGLKGKPFSIVKFRTMKLEGPDESTADGLHRLSQFGHFMRKSSLDELPQLWNVMRGEMSFVGPRPLLIHYAKCYTAEQARRMDVKPGITGLAQVRGRNLLSWDEKFALDLAYVDSRSFLLDASIVMQTVYQVVLSKGISPSKSLMVEPFCEDKTSS